MATSKLIPVSMLVLLLLACSGPSMVSADQQSMIDMVNALKPGASQNQDMNMMKPVPDSIKKMLPEDIKSAMEDISVKDLKKELKAGKDALKKCMQSKESPKECMKDLKEVMPKLTKLAKAVMKSMKKLYSKLISKIQEIIPKLNSQLLKNILQTALNVMPKPSSKRRRKRSTDALDRVYRKKRDASSIMSQIKSLMQSPMSKDQIKSLLKQIKQAIIKALSGSPNILQEMVNMLSSKSPKIAKFFSNPKVMSFLGTSAPPSSS